jgi:hypothetical protein
VGYRRLPPKKALAVADTTGLNPGGWTISADLSDVTRLTEFELYHITIDGPVGFGAAMYVNNDKWSHTAQGWQNEWDPAQPLPVRQSDTLSLLFAAPFTAGPYTATNIQPSATFWFRYDAALFDQAGT